MKTKKALAGLLGLLGSLAAFLLFLVLVAAPPFLFTASLPKKVIITIINNIKIKTKTKKHILDLRPGKTYLKALDKMKNWKLWRE